MDHREADEKISVVLEEFDENAYRKILKSDFPKTFAALFGYIAKTESIKAAMFEMADSENIYSMKILYRSLCEHFLRFQYILYRFILEKNDSVGHDYYLFFETTENIELANAIKASQTILGQSDQFDTLEFIRKKHPELKGLSNREIRRKSDQFRYRNIVQYISQNFDSIVNAESPLLANIIPVYSKLSSFIHGGPSADWFVASVVSTDEDRELVIKDARMAFLISAFVKAFTFLAYSKVKPDYVKTFSKINAVMDEFLGTESKNNTLAGDLAVLRHFF